MLEALGSIQTQQKQNKQRKRNGKYESDKSATDQSSSWEHQTAELYLVAGAAPG